MKKIKFDMASDGDTGEIQLVLFLGTKKDNIAKKRAQDLCNFLSTKYELSQKKYPGAK